MPDKTGLQQITRSRETIHNPDDARHFMRIKPVPGHVRVLYDGDLLAESNQTLRVLEVGSDIYDPVFYFPPSHVQATLAPLEKRTFCPLKGHASYFALVSDHGAIQVPEIAWCYGDTLDFASELKDLIAFDASLVVFEQHPACSPSPRGSQSP